MDEDASQAAESQRAAAEMPAQKPASPSPAPSSTPGHSLNLGAAAEPLRDSSQVNAVTVLALLDKLVAMLDTVQDNQRTMERRQISLEGSVKGIQSDLTNLAECQTSAGRTVAQLLEMSRKVSAHTRAVRERMERQCAQVRRLEDSQAQLLRRNHFRVLIFQEEDEIPANIFVKEPVSSPAEGKGELADENKSLEETLHNVELSSEDELPHADESLEDSAEETTEESRAERLRRSSLRKVDSLKKAFSRQNIGKRMNQLGTKIISVERREKIKKSLTSNHQKRSSGKSSPFKVSPLSFGRKKVQEGEGPAEYETKSEDTQSRELTPQDQEESSFAEGLSEASVTDATVEGVEGKGLEGEAAREPLRENNPAMHSKVNLTIVEDAEEESVSVEQGQYVQYEGGHALTSEETERSDKGPAQPAVLQVDQTA